LYNHLLRRIALVTQVCDSTCTIKPQFPLANGAGMLTFVYSTQKSDVVSFGIRAAKGFSVSGLVDPIACMSQLHLSTDFGTAREFFQICMAVLGLPAFIMKHGLLLQAERQKEGQ
jgi:hypothetical protein